MLAFIVSVFIPFVFILFVFILATSPEIDANNRKQTTSDFSIEWVLDSSDYESSVHLRSAGDLMFHRSVQNYVKEKGISALFKKIKTEIQEPQSLFCQPRITRIL